MSSPGSVAATSPPSGENAVRKPTRKPVLRCSGNGTCRSASESHSQSAGAPVPTAARNRPSGEMKRAHVLTGALSGCPEPTSQPNTAAVPGGLASTARPSGVKTSCVNPVSGTRWGGAGDRSGPACRQDPASQRRTRPPADAVARNFPSGENATRVIGPVWPISGEHASSRPAGSPGATVVAAAGRPTMVDVLALRSTLPAPDPAAWKAGGGGRPPAGA